MTALCPGSPLDLSDACTRESWNALIPTFFVILLLFLHLFSRLPIPARIKPLVDAIKAPFGSFLSVEEAEGLVGGGEEISCEPGVVVVQQQNQPRTRRGLWARNLLVGIGLLEVLGWVVVFAQRVIRGNSETEIWALLIALTWLYTLPRLILLPTPNLTLPFDILTLYIVHLVAALVQRGAMVHDHLVYGTPYPSLLTVTGVGIFANLVGILGGMGVLLGMRLGVPSKGVRVEEIGISVSPEDYTTLWEWISFYWIWPLVKKGTNTTLNEKDVWPLSVTFQSKVVFAKFNTISASSLLWKLIKANSLDLILDPTLKFISILFAYATPFFLQQILSILDFPNPTPSDKFRAYVYALMMFVFALCKSQADLQELWIARRASTRIRSELMAAVYDKALKRRDYSGVTSEASLASSLTTSPTSNNGNPKLKTEKKSKPYKRTRKEDEKKARGARAKQGGGEAEEKAGADIGKIVNLMSSDASMLSDTALSMSMIYGAPLELLIGGVYLYRLMGLSSFSGFLALILGWPLNSFLTKRAFRIRKGLMGARDKRMGVLGELLGGVKLIKFFAWEDKWIKRVLGEREVEIGWIVKSRMNNLMFVILWISAPIIISVVSFWVYIATGHKLTISTAFTAVYLFGMIRMPMNIIPAFIVQFMQAGVSLKRIEVYLNEDEVPVEVSSLKPSSSSLFPSLSPSDNDNAETANPYARREGEPALGLDNASFKWNEVEKEGEDIIKQQPPSSEAGSSSSASSSSSPEGSFDSSSASVALSESTDGATTTTTTKFELKDITVFFPERRLTVVTGPTASGKTALLMALLGEMTLLSGRAIISKDPTKTLDTETGLTQSISYAAQTPWLQHRSIKDNILFGFPFDEERYKSVVKACALEPDLGMLEDGDETEIGIRGVSLSGGQKARVALARAVYARTQYVLLDDPLSAVDSHTARFLYDELLRGTLLANRTVILVTHHVDLVLPGAYYLVRMLDGRIDTQGTIQSLREQGVLEDIVIHDAADTHKAQAIEEQVEVVEGTDPKEPAEVAAAKAPRKLVQEEKREQGSVKWPVYNSYLKASSYWLFGLLLFIIVIQQFVQVADKVWMKIWGEAYQDEGDSSPASFFGLYHHFSTHQDVMEGHGHLRNQQVFTKKGTFGIDWPKASEHPMFYVAIFAAIGFADLSVRVASRYVQITSGLRASKKLFNQLLVAIARATFRFHDTTPQGRLLNRFGKDVETIDTSLPQSLQFVNVSLAQFFSSVITVAVIYPIFLLPASFLTYIYQRLARSYLNTGRDLRRMDSTSRSPIFSDFQELLEGIVTVRAFSAEKRFLDVLHEKIDGNTKMWYTFWMTNRWLLVNFDAIGAVAVLAATLLSVAYDNGAGLAALCIVSALNFSMAVYWTCRYWTNLELDFNAVERVIEYLNVPQEPPALIEDARAPAYWPSSSRNDALVRVEKLTVRYAPDLPEVLHDVSFTLKSGERVGLLGRTGSGKSTLAMSLLRFVDPAEGKILIDGIDITSIGLHDLRSRLTFIPQDAVLFSGTLRENLDPFDEHDDSECLDVLYRVQLISPSSRSQSAVQSPETSRPPSIHNLETIPGTETATETASISTSITEVDAKPTISLDTQVSAGGHNFSQGQRQLIAMARALLRRTSIIILDEATSSIDFETDKKIQAAIRTEFTDSLLLTVAHRLRTVIDYDRLLVLDKGKVVEFDTPLALIEKQEGIFRGMCLKSGQFDELYQTAKAKAER